MGDLWQQHGGSAPAPPVDFDQQIVLGVFYGGSFHAGCRSKVDVVREVRREGATLEVSIGRLSHLGPCRAVTHPFDLVVVDVPSSQALDVWFVGRVLELPQRSASTADAGCDGPASHQQPCLLAPFHLHTALRRSSAEH